MKISRPFRITIICVLGICSIVFSTSAQSIESRVEFEYILTLSASEKREKAEAGNAIAQWMMANDYLIANDVNKAIEWFTKAASQGMTRAQIQLSEIYSHSPNLLPITREKVVRDIPLDHKQAYEWLKKAAYGGNTFAQVELGIMYLSGNGIPKDDVKACAWIYVADNTAGSDMCDSILTQNQMIRALKMADEIKANIRQVK